MSAREDLMAAAKSLQLQGYQEFSPAALIGEAHRLGSSYPDATLRSMIVHHLRVDKGPVSGGTGFLKVNRGSYRLGTSNESAASSRPSQQTTEITPTPDTDEDARSSIDGHEWFWEGNIQAAVVRHLATDGWRIRRVADTHSREHGVDIEADRGEISLLIEVKGYPSSTYRGGTNEGQKKTFGVGAQARNYFGNAVLTGLLMRSDNSGARVVLAFPTFETFRALARRSGRPLQQAGIEIWLVDERGVVTEDVGVDNHSSKFEWQTGDVVLLNDDVDSAPRRVSSLLRQFLNQLSESATSFTGWLIHATLGSAGGVGTLRTNRSGCAV